MLDRPDWRRAGKLNKPMASVQILSLLNTICNMYMYITCILLKEIFTLRGRDWCRYRESGRDCRGARGHHLCLTDTILQLKQNLWGQRRPSNCQRHNVGSDLSYR